MIPALGLFEAGLLRAKNTTSVLTQCFAGALLCCFCWHMVGFSLVFGTPSWGLYGSPAAYPMLLHVSLTECFTAAPTVPMRAYAMFQMMFAAIAPLLMTGAFAERLRWPAYLGLILGFEFLVYYPVAHWVWGGGWLQRFGCIDFAGGITIHTTAGVGSIVTAWWCGPRLACAHTSRTSRTSGTESRAAAPSHEAPLLDAASNDEVGPTAGDMNADAIRADSAHGRQLEAAAPSSLPLAAIGGALLWLGWFGFNAGSAMSAGSVATAAVSNTQAGAVGSSIVWMGASSASHWRRSGRLRMSLAAVLNGMLAGLAGITPASGFISADWALVCGAMLGMASLAVEHFVKHTLCIDDALDVGAVHGATGALGSLLIGVFASAAVNPTGEDGLINGGGASLLGKQAVGVAAAVAHSAVVTSGLCFVLSRTVGLRVDASHEIIGLDQAEHEEAAYEWLVVKEGDVAGPRSLS